MDRRSPWTRLAAASTWTLVRHEWRVLARNRMACVVLLCAPLAAGMIRLDRERRPDAPNETCYVVYWQETGWVRHLKQSAAEARRSHVLRIEVVPVEQLTGPDGIIRYPGRAHSIQLRPLNLAEVVARSTEPATHPTKGLHEPSGDLRSHAVRGQEIRAQPPNGYLIWYWYSGSDSAALWPYAQWFQQATLEYFGEDLRWLNRTSPLQPELNVPGTQTRLGADALLDSDWLDAAFIWSVLFFAACHLPKLSLAEARESRTLQSFVITPTGWQGVSTAVRLFYGILAVATATAVAATLNPHALLDGRYWITVIGAVVLYLGVGLTIASWCGSVSSAGVGTAVYLLASASFYGLTVSLPAPVGADWSQHAFAEGAIWHSLHLTLSPTGSNLPLPSKIVPGEPPETNWASGGGGLVAIILWGALWHVLGTYSFRRLKDPD